MQKQIFKTFFFLAIFLMLPHFANAFDPTTEPLLSQSDLQYLGAFRVPQGRLGTVSQTSPSLGSDGGVAMSYNPINNSLFMGGSKYEVLLAELKIPSTIVKSTTISNLTTATVQQNPLDVTSGLGCFIGPVQNNPLYFGYGSPSSECSAVDVADSDMGITLSGTSGTITVTRDSGTWDTSKVFNGFILMEPNGGNGTVQNVTPTALTITSNYPFTATHLVNSSSDEYPGWVLNNMGGNTLSDGGVVLGGTLVDSVNNKLIGTTYTAYDGPGSTTLSHFTANLDWSTSVGTRGMYQVGTAIYDTNNASAGFVDGYMTWIPNEWQSLFGKTALTGNGALRIMSRTSSGPAVFAFNPSDLGNGTLGTTSNPVPATPLVYYPGTHLSIGNVGSSNNPAFNLATEITGVVFPSGTRSVLFFGRTGMGAGCYGQGTINESEAISNADMVNWIFSHNSQASYDACNIAANDTPAKIASCIVAGGGTGYTCDNQILDASGNDACCYDPSGSSKGAHDYPEDFFVWAYDANDLLLVKQGAVLTPQNRSANIVDSSVDPTCANGQVIQPWCVKPYAMWDLGADLDVFGLVGDDGIAGHGDNKIFGAAYDPATQRIYLSAGVDGSLPLIQVYQVNANTVVDTTPPAAPTSLVVM